MDRETIKKIAEQPEPPCTIFDCKFIGSCKENLLACQSFKFYVTNGVSYKPSTEWHGNKKKLRMYENKDFRPTRKIYDLVFKDE